jgi:hypothetical protein
MGRRKKPMYNHSLMIQSKLVRFQEVWLLFIEQERYTLLASRLSSSSLEERTGGMMIMIQMNTNIVVH